MTVRPQHAASLVITRRTAKGNEVLLGKREPRHRFIPNVFVFPGGRIDPADADCPAVSELCDGVFQRLSAQAGPRRARALAIAAVRETMEETGLVFGEVRAGRLLPALAPLDYIARAITPPNSPIRFHARFFHIDATDAGGTLGGSGELLELHWVPIAEAFRLPLVDVTEFVLQEIGRTLAGTVAPGLPLFSYRLGRPVIRYQ